MNPRDLPNTYFSFARTACNNAISSLVSYNCMLKHFVVVLEWCKIIFPFTFFYMRKLYTLKSILRGMVWFACFMSYVRDLEDMEAPFNGRGGYLPYGTSFLQCGFQNDWREGGYMRSWAMVFGEH